MSKAPKGMFEVEVEMTESSLYKKSLALRPKLINAIEVLEIIEENDKSWEDLVEVYYAGTAHPYRVRMSKDKFYKLMDSVEED